ncbi:pseudouridine synthase [Athelia psychrophila]|uniref:Pseudouridine synthase n=1 Tax=Athelia psychrophila TaxID=1759441 RepID=A0A166SZY5_9AGAM|nr:pseudouridine synthase [Fibularhizoctonia sp. CBS 109695]
MKPSTGPTDNAYERWTKDELIARLHDVDSRLRQAYSDGPELTQSPRSDKEFIFSAHPVRKIALKFSYSGSEYCGLAYQKNALTPLPTVEEVLFQALAKVRLVDPDAGLDGCGWDRCGRTDRGVSAAGQVVSLWVRSRIGAGKPGALALESAAGSDATIAPLAGGLLDDTQEQKETDNILEPSLPELSPTPRPRPEFHYVQLLNRILPPTIRVIAWSPVEPSFSSRFNCRRRHYKYFFSSQGLDVSLMRDAAERLLGEHDFRNLCKLDPTKQIKSFHRSILRAEISPVPDVKDLYVFDLVGSAFLYHQVRHIMAILFLVGTGLEHPSVVSSLLNVHPDNLPSPLLVRAGDPPLTVVDTKPEYVMADGLPLMLWDCTYPEDDVHWRATPDVDASSEKGGQGSGTELSDQMQSIHSRSTIHTVLDAHFMSAVAAYHPPGPAYFPRNDNPHPIPAVMQLPLGGGMTKRESTYKPILLRRRQESVEVMNERWRLGKGERLAQRRQLEAQVDEE